VTDAAWRSRRANIAGFLGNDRIDLRISSIGNARWRVAGKTQDRVAGCIDLDLGFTPATNLLALRRLSLKVGQCAEAPAAYLEFPRMRFVRLPQTYERLGRTEYRYEAPTVGYFATLQVSPSGAVIEYPGLFERVVSG
jgi:hypothetical protein